MLNPSSSPSPSLTSQDFNNNRKRLRTLSLESASSSSSPKRSMSQDPSLDTHDTPRPNDLPTPPAEDAKQAADVDVYMAEQGEASGEATATNPLEASSSSTSPLTLREKYLKISPLVKRDMVVGETWYVVSRRWYRRWEKACTGSVDKEGAVEEKDLGPVDNGHLVDFKGNIATTSVTEGVDVQFLPQEAWDLIVSWYGEPNTPIPRKVIKRGLAQEITLELFPPKLYAHVLTPDSAGALTPSTPVEVVVSSTDALRDVRKKLFDAVCSDSANAEFKVWALGEWQPTSKYISLSEFKRMDAPDQLVGDTHTFEDSVFEDQDAFAVEVKQDGQWLVQDTKDSQTALSSSQQTPPADNEPTPLFQSGSDFFSQMQAKKPQPVSTLKSAIAAIRETKDPRPAPKASTITPGTLGLGNMGNTCFMNSAIQCLVHTPELADYFLTGVFEKELNPDNPLGMHGQIAQAFGALLRKIWAPTSSATSYSPREFKAVLSKFAPQFSGYQQHDSQELVAFLLDGLHEDLNRIIKKPYVEKPDWEGGGDKELVSLARESWDGYLKRNDSVIVDLFQGQYQSTLVCPECEKVSITFDPFMYLTLPLPVQKKWKHTVHYVPWDLEKPHLKVPVEINRDSSFKDLRNLFGRWFDVNPENLLTLEIFNHRFYKNLDDTIICGDMTDNDVIVCFELPCNSKQARTYKKSDEDPIIIPVVLCDTPSRSRVSYGSNHSHFGYPFLTVVTPEQAKSKDAVYDLIVERLCRWTENVRDLYQWELRSASASMEEVPIPLSNGPTVETITEIKENGEIVTVQGGVPEEGDIVDQKSVVVQEQDYDAMDTEDDAPRRTGFKKGLFQMLVSPGSSQFAVSYGSFSSSKTESIDHRAEAAEEIGEPVLNEGETILCEFDEHTKAYYFGEQPKYEHAKWQLWEEFVHPEIKASREAASQKKSRGISLQDCLDEFTKKEQLGEDDLWYCPRCKKHQQATKSFDLWSVPDVLVVHLKRFSNSRILRDKIDTFVDFPLSGLDLTSMVGQRKVASRLVEKGEDPKELGLDDIDEPLVYDLFAVDEHLGGLGGGHYRAYALNSADQQWHHFDDSYVSPARPEAAVNQNAYLLFYRRRASRPLGGKTHDIVQTARVSAQQSPAAQPDGALPEIKLEDSGLLTPPADDDDGMIGSRRHGTSSLLKMKISPDTWRPPHTDWDNTSTSPASTPPPLDDLEPPTFEDSQLDPILQTSLPPLQLSAAQFDFPDPTSRGSPSSVRAEFDQDQEQDIELDSDDSGSRNWSNENDPAAWLSQSNSRSLSQEDLSMEAEPGKDDDMKAVLNAVA
ncbi:uncharacterized protein PHACADRAFT_129620 [Phanerochaete carnosa HHB-10118-sp]|uniref:ubiquitinyl hydrolase 1 n=1 Tax=Phanerochaete carnosa (strain HHB-10118-sp) TaxID=650164 RepID=K5VUG4_PHACS|nr:uncharacterized protein PHACADRAFT_129620 [Phanerochaete carnosa HHB-10118-sp]EKM50435.1 hypothetical protein PHACADRAFT_129620 [Phanerochaete carnosa HHB-10118-sp]